MNPSTSLQLTYNNLLNAITGLYFVISLERKMIVTLFQTRLFLTFLKLRSDNYYMVDIKRPNHG
jgi:hypothetical protein